LCLDVTRLGEDDACWWERARARRAVVQPAEVTSALGEDGVADAERRSYWVVVRCVEATVKGWGGRDGLLGGIAIASVVAEPTR
jgi:hypothetical protein